MLLLSLCFFGLCKGVGNGLWLFRGFQNPGKLPEMDPGPFTRDSHGGLENLKGGGI